MKNFHTGTGKDIWEPERVERVEEYTSTTIKCPIHSTMLYKNTSVGRKPRLPDGAKIRWTGDVFQIELFDYSDTGEYLCEDDDVTFYREIKRKTP